NRTRQVHGDPRAFRRALHGWICFLRFRRTRHSRSAVISQQPHWHPFVRRKHHNLGRRLSSTPVRLSLRRRRHAPPEDQARRKRNRQTPGVRENQRRKDEEVRVRKQG